MLSLPLDQIVCGNAFDVLPTFPKSSIDTVMFSPPYWGLRDYKLPSHVFGGSMDCQHEWGSEVLGDTRTVNTEKDRWQHDPKPNGEVSPHIKISQGNFCVLCGAWRGSFGLEPHPQLYIDHLALLCRLLRRVLKREGSMFINLGDTYCGSHCGYGDKRHANKRNPSTLQLEVYNSTPKPQANLNDGAWLQPKQLLLIPSRCAIVLQEDGWILRNDVVWHKPNHMPSSVKDRLTNSWEHIFHFVKSRRYFYDLDAIREPHATHPHNGKPMKQLGIRAIEKLVDKSKGWTMASGMRTEHPLGKAPDDTITTLNSKREDLDYTPISGGGNVNMNIPHQTEIGKNPDDFWSITTQPYREAHFATYPESLCTRPIKATCPKNGVVLDPMCGSGTTLLAAFNLGRHYVGIELNPAYVKLAQKRLGNQRRLLEPQP